MPNETVNKSFGCTGEMLRVDLSRGEVSRERLDPKAMRDYIGGRGMAAYLLSKETPKGVDPYGEENRLIFASGPLTGSKLPYSSRMAVVTKSPASFSYTRAMTGGFFPAVMKHCGFDCIVIQGISAKPVYLSVDNGEAELLSAADVWGKGVYDTAENLRARHGKKSRFALIGQAGENRVPYAGIVVDLKSAAGRGGVGTVMGAKRLKGIVLNSSINYCAAKEDNMDRFVKEVRDIVRDTPGIQAFAKVGTPGGTTNVNGLGVLPTRNFQTGVFEGIAGISIDALKEFEKGKAGCYACPVACKKKHIVEDGPYKTEVFGPEYETIGLIGANCGNSDIASIIHANYLCNDYSLDTMSTGNVIAYAMECFSRGILTTDDTDGLELGFGNHESIIALIHKIAKKEGIGARLARGVKTFSEDLGATAFAAQTKGLEFPSYDVRGLQGFGLAFAVGNRGACHNLTSMFKAELAAEETDRFETEGKGPVWRRWALNFAIYDSVCLCSFSRGFMNRELIAKALSDATGYDISVDELILVAERVYTLEKMYNLREGLTKADDTLPERFLKEPMPDGPAKGQVNRLEEMLEDSYAAMGWDSDGVPTPELLKKLNLEGEVG